MNVFGGSGASKFLRKWTQILGVVFVASCLFLAFQVSNVTVAKAPKILEEKFGETQAPAQPASPEAQTGTQPAQTPPAESNPGE